MKTIIAGSRDYGEEYPSFAYMVIESIVDKCPWPITEVVSGACRGVDQLGEKWASEKGVPVKPFPYRSDLGRAGGPVRNREMAEYADAAIVFLMKGAESKGSRNMIGQALTYNLHLLVVHLQPIQRNKSDSK